MRSSTGHTDRQMTKKSFIVTSIRGDVFFSLESKNFFPKNSVEMVMNYSCALLTRLNFWLISMLTKLIRKISSQLRWIRALGQACLMRDQLWAIYHSLLGFLFKEQLLENLIIFSLWKTYFFLWLSLSLSLLLPFSLLRIKEKTLWTCAMFIDASREKRQITSLTLENIAVTPATISLFVSFNYIKVVFFLLLNLFCVSTHSTWIIS